MLSLCSVSGRPFWLLNCLGIAHLECNSNATVHQKGRVVNVDMVAFGNMIPPLLIFTLFATLREMHHFMLPA